MLIDPCGHSAAFHLRVLLGNGSRRGPGACLSASPTPLPSCVRTGKPWPSLSPRGPLSGTRALEKIMSDAAFSNTGTRVIREIQTQLFTWPGSFTPASQKPSKVGLEEAAQRGEWAAQGHTAERQQSWDENQVCLAPPSVPFHCSMMPLGAFPALAFAHLFLDFREAGFWESSPREIPVSCVLEQGLRVPGQRESR